VLQLRVFRINGDSLSCWFTPEGALSTARLTVEGQMYDVIGQLPGLRRWNAVRYLEDLGFVFGHERGHSLDCICVGKHVNNVLSESDLLVDTVIPTGAGRYLISVIPKVERTRVATCRLFVVDCVWKDDVLTTLSSSVARDELALSRFLSAMTSCERRV